MTKEQLKWLNKLAASTPFDASDIAQTYTLARSYGFASDEAKGLTQDISEFAAGMGLSGEHIERIIQNFGQMKAAGKITGTEIRDLARGSFVPVNDILERTAESLGITTDELADLRRQGLPDAEVFFRAFSGMVDDDFAGAGKDMNKVLSVAIGNIKDMARAFLSLEVVKGIFESVASKVSAFQDALFGRWDELESIFVSIGTTVTEIVTEIVGLTPSAESMADGVVNGFSRISEWLIENKGGIVQWVKDSAAWIKDELIPALKDIGTWIHDNVITSFNKISDWVSENKETISAFFTTLGEIIREVFGDITNRQGAGGDDFLGSLLSGITAFMQYVIDNQDKIATWVEVLWSVFAVLSVLKTLFIAGAKIILWLAGIVLWFSSVWFFLSNAVSGIGIILTWVSGIIATIGAPILVLIGLVALLAYMWKIHGAEVMETARQLVAIISYYWNKFWSETGRIFSQVWFLIKYYWGRMWDSIKEVLGNIWDSVRTKFDEIRDKITNIDWWGTGKNIIQGIINGVSNMSGNLASEVRTAAVNAYNAALSALGIRSPSKLFTDIGENIMGAMASGVLNTADLVAKAVGNAADMTVAVGMNAQNAMASSMAPSSSVSNVTNTNNFNLSINSSANTEPVIQDFEMLQSLAG
jgi:tape measure domain-containing protein